MCLSLSDNVTPKEKAALLNYVEEGHPEYREIADGPAPSRDLYEQVNIYLDKKSRATKPTTSVYRRMPSPEFAPFFLF